MPVSYTLTFQPKTSIFDWMSNLSEIRYWYASFIFIYAQTVPSEITKLKAKDSPKELSNERINFSSVLLFYLLFCSVLFSFLVSLLFFSFLACSHLVSSLLLSSRLFFVFFSLLVFTFLLCSFLFSSIWLRSALLVA